MNSRVAKIGAWLAAVLLVADGSAYWRFTREIPVRTVAPEQNVEVCVFGIGAIEAEIVSKVGFQVAGKVVAAVIVVTHDEKIFDRFDQIHSLRDGALEPPQPKAA